MAIKRTHSESGTYFCTFTCIKWLSLIEETDLYDNIYHWFRIINEKHQVTGFVVMPNHLHILIHIRENGDIINKVLANGKRFMAYEIVRRLEAKNRAEFKMFSKRYSMEFTTVLNSVIFESITFFFQSLNPDYALENR